MNDKRCRRRRSADGCGICFVAGLYVVFFQAEDGIRDGHVTGVQTCALPISNVGSLTLASLTTFVLDEADRMLDMGFQQSQIGRASCRERGVALGGGGEIKEKRWLRRCGGAVDRKAGAWDAVWGVGRIGG